jgi:hypothetical protein
VTGFEGRRRAEAGHAGANQAIGAPRWDAGLFGGPRFAESCEKSKTQKITNYPPLASSLDAPLRIRKRTPEGLAPPTGMDFRFGSNCSRSWLL